LLDVGRISADHARQAGKIVSPVEAQTFQGRSRFVRHLLHYIQVFS
jgi:hypothetical protein